MASRITAARVSAMVLAGAGLLLGSAAQAQTTRLALGMSGWTGFAPLSLADKAGIFKSMAWRSS